MEEIWKPVKGYEKLYQISNLGNLFALEKRVKCRGGKFRTLKAKMLTPAFDKDGYKFVYLYKDGCKSKNFKIHRLVAIHFIPNPENKKEVNHKNGVKDDNHVNNLEWSTPKENMRHAVKNNLYKSGEEHHNYGGKCHRSRLVLNIETGVFYDCMKDALECTNFSSGHFSRMLNGLIENRTNFIFA